MAASKPPTVARKRSCVARQPVDAHRDVPDPRLRHLRGQRGVDAAAAGGHARSHARLADRAHHVEEAGVEVGLAADERHLLRAHLGELAHEVERLGGAELVGPRLGGARAAVGAALIAGERELPDDVARVRRGAERRASHDAACGDEIAQSRSLRSSMNAGP